MTHNAYTTQHKTTHWLFIKRKQNEIERVPSILYMLKDELSGLQERFFHILSSASYQQKNNSFSVTYNIFFIIFIIELKTIIKWEKTITFWQKFQWRWVLQIDDVHTHQRTEKLLKFEKK
jgi:hypothetical protein